MELAQLLAAVTGAAEPDEALERICLFVEERLAGCRCSVLALDGWVLACAAAPNLPAEYVRAANGLRLDPGMMPGIGGRPALEPLAAPGLSLCGWAPVVSSSDALLGILAVHAGSEFPAGGEAVRDAAARLAAVVLERRGLERRMTFETNHDATTGLLNRRRFLDLLESEMSAAAQDDAALSVLSVDIDRFRQVNEAVGPEGGDRLLRYAGERLRSSFADGIVARTGSDEFAVASRLPSARLQEMARAALAGPFTVCGRELFVACAAGMATAPDDAIDAASLLQHAESAQHRSRAGGSGDIVRYRAPRGATSDFDIEQQLRHALTGSELELKYQPLYKASGALSGFEALLACGSIPPHDFIRVAEVSGMIVPIGAWVLDHACSRAAGWNAGGKPVRLSVNVSAIQFAMPRFVEVVHGALRRSGLAARRLELEITESVLMRDVEQSIRRMAELRRTGIRLAIDDFGTGFSSLNYLRLLPATTVKIDRSFVRDLTESSGARTVVESVIQLAHTLGFEVVAEGVETERQFTLLRAAGCDCVQGHFFGKAMPAAEAEALLKSAAAPATLMPVQAD